MSEKIFTYKMVIFGNVGVGKTSLVEQFINKRFEKNYISTIGYNVYEKRLSVMDLTIRLMIFDVGGQEKFRELRHKYAQDANTAFIIYDITDRPSFVSVPEWRKDLAGIAGDIPFIIIGNKSDLQKDRQVSVEDAQKLSSELGALSWFETSAKTGKGVEEAFTQLAKRTYEYYTQ